MTQATVAPFKLSISEKVEGIIGRYRADEKIYGIKVRFVLKSEDLSEVRIVLEMSESFFKVLSICEGDTVHDYTRTYSTYAKAMRNAALDLVECFID